MGERAAQQALAATGLDADHPGFGSATVLGPSHAAQVDDYRAALQRVRATGADVDVLPAVCGERVCPAAVGNVVVNLDNHLSNTYVRSLAVWLGPRWGL